MLIRFDSKVGMITMFGDIATKLLKLMGQTGSVPGAILAHDIPAAVQRLRRGVGTEPQESTNYDEDGDTPVNLGNRAFPLIELLERAAKKGADVIWEEERKSF